MSIGQTLDRLTCSVGRKEERSLVARTWSSSQFSLIITLFLPTPRPLVLLNVERSGRRNC